MMTTNENEEAEGDGDEGWTSFLNLDDAADAEIERAVLAPDADACDTGGAGAPVDAIDSGGAGVPVDASGLPAFDSEAGAGLLAMPTRSGYVNPCRRPGHGPDHGSCLFCNDALRLLEIRRLMGVFVYLDEEARRHVATSRAYVFLNSNRRPTLQRLTLLTGTPQTAHGVLASAAGGEFLPEAEAARARYAPDMESRRTQSVPGVESRRTRTTSRPDLSAVDCPFDEKTGLCTCKRPAHECPLCNHDKRAATIASLESKIAHLRGVVAPDSDGSAASRGRADRMRKFQFELARVRDHWDACRRRAHVAGQPQIPP
jgi:hypothetical protein